MNYSRAIFLISDEVRAVNVTYEDTENASRTMYKTLDQNLKVDDYVVVPTTTRHGMTVCKVVEVDVDPEIESPAKMGWVLDTVDKRMGEDIKRQEEEAMEKIKSAEKRRKRAELRESLLADAEDEVKALPIYNIKSETK